MRVAGCRRTAARQEDDSVKLYRVVQEVFVDRTWILEAESEEDAREQVELGTMGVSADYDEEFSDYGAITDVELLAD